MAVLRVAGGCGEHGRNCFRLTGDAPGQDVLVDCGLMAGAEGSPYPRLAPDEIAGLAAVLLTHSHADHSGAVPWLRGQGFRGRVVATARTLAQLPFDRGPTVALEDACPGGAGELPGMRVRWGRSGHCAGSVWYLLELGEGGPRVLFTGDYTERSLAYACDRIRGVRADASVVDCAYGEDATSFEERCAQIVGFVAERACEGPVLLPVPRYGRGVDLALLLRRELPGLELLADGRLRAQVGTLADEGDPWARPGADLGGLSGDLGELPRGRRLPRAVLLACDPQLRGEAARELAGRVLDQGGALLMTGTPERGSLSERLVREGRMAMLRYPVHQRMADVDALRRENDLGTEVLFHCPELPARERYELV